MTATLAFGGVGAAAVEAGVWAAALKARPEASMRRQTSERFIVLKNSFGYSCFDGGSG
jgi:hypothetical protein